MKITNRQGNTCLFSFALGRGILKVEKHAGHIHTEPARHALKEKIFGACPTALPGNVSPKAENAGHSAALSMELGGTSAACATSPTACLGMSPLRLKTRATALPFQWGRAALSPPARRAPPPCLGTSPLRLKTRAIALPSRWDWAAFPPPARRAPPQVVSGAFFPRRRSGCLRSAWPCPRFSACGWPCDGRRSSPCC